MSTEQVQKSDELSKSIDALLDEVFGEPESTEKSIDIAKDAKTTADAALSGVPAGQKDEARGAGRPKQISDVPQNDVDGRRDSQYDAAIADSSGEKEPDEAKKQAKAVDQCSSQGHMAESSKAPRVAPFKKSDGSDLTEEDFRQFEAFQKSQREAAAEKNKAEELQKAEKAKAETAALIKSAVDSATASVRRENEELRKSLLETNTLVKAMAAQPMPAKSITQVQALEKSVRPEDKGQEAFSKSEVLDAAMELAMKGQIPDTAVSEIEMTNRCSNAEVRAKIEKHLESKN